MLRSSAQGSHLPFAMLEPEAQVGLLACRHKNSEFKMFAARNFSFIDHINLNLDAMSRHQPVNMNIHGRFQTAPKTALSAEDLFTHVNLRALEALGVDGAQPLQLRFTVAPVVNPFAGESNWRVIVDRAVTDRERSAIHHAASKVQRIFDMVDNYQAVRALIV
jgi:hypothetical protein